MARALHAWLSAVLLSLGQQEAAGAAGSRAFGVVRRLFIHPDMSAATVPRIKIGTPVTFNLSYADKSMQNSYELFFSYYIDTYKGVLVSGIRHAVELVLVDDTGTPSGAKLAAEYLVKEEGIKYFLGPRDGWEINDKVSQVVHAARGVQVVPGTISPRVFRGRPAVFGVKSPQFPEDGPLFAMLGAADNHSRKTLTYLAYSAPSQRLNGSAATHGIDLVKEVRVQRGNLRAHLRKAVDLARQPSPDILMAALFDDTACHELLAYMKLRDYSPKAVVLWGCPALGAYDSHLKHGTGVIIVGAWRTALPFEGNLTGTWTPESFGSAYRRKYAAVPLESAAAAFVAAAALVHGIEGARSPNPWHVAQTLRAMREDSIFGTIQFDRNGQSTTPLPVMSYTLNRLHLLAPCTQCQMTLKYPKPTFADMECHDPRLAYRSIYGYFNGVCRVCPPGGTSQTQWQAGEVIRVCKACSRGRYGILSYGGAGAVCVPCSKGYFSNRIGSKQCTACPSGQFGNRSGLTECSFCAAGRYTKVRGQHSCAKCQPGTFLNETGGQFCRRCARGTYSETSEATGCDACLPSLTTSGTGFSSASDCGCPAGTFDVSRWDAAAVPRCEPVPEGVTTSGFGAPLEIAPGYYEDMGDFDPFRGVWKCNQEGACPGGAPGTCSGGLEGIACSMCPDGQAPVGKSCGNCHSANIVFPVVLGVGGPIFVVSFYYLAAPDLITKHTPVKLGVSIMLGVTVTVVQVLGMLFQLNIRWPEQVRPILEGSSTLVASGDIFGYECVLGKEPQNTYIFTSLVPFAVVALFIVMLFASRLLPTLTRGRLQAWPYPEAINALGGLGQISFIVLSAQAAYAVQCYTHPNGRLSMLKYPSVICFEDGPHALILGFGGLLLLCFVFPFMAMSLWGNYSTYISALTQGVDAPQLIMYRFLIYRYRPMVWWWGAVFNARQLLLGLAPMVTPNDPGLQVTIVLLVLLIYLMLLLTFLPWRSYEINAIDVAITSLMSCMMISVSNLVPASRYQTRHYTLLAVSVALTLITVAVAIFHTLMSFLLRGCSGEYGVRFPKQNSLDRFAASWVKLIRRLSEIADDSHLHMLQELDDFDRSTIDRVICIIASMLDLEQRKSWRTTRFSDWTPACKVLRTSAGSFHTTLRVSMMGRQTAMQGQLARGSSNSAQSEGERGDRNVSQSTSDTAAASQQFGRPSEVSSEAAPQLLGKADDVAGQMSSEAAPQPLKAAELQEAEQCRQECGGTEGETTTTRTTTTTTTTTTSTKAAEAQEAPGAQAAAAAAAAGSKASSRQPADLCQQTAQLMGCKSLPDPEDPAGRAAACEAFRTSAFLEEEVACQNHHVSL